MKNIIRVLIVEDLSSDAELIKRETVKYLPKADFLVVETCQDFLSALVDFGPDIILANYMIPGFNGMTALKLALKHVPDIPFIIVAGSLNVETAVKCMKAGAWDYVIKEQMINLGSAIICSLKQKKLRQERKHALEALQESEERYRNLLEVTPVCIAVQSEGKIVFVNQAGLKLLGAESTEQLIGKPISEIIHPENLAKSARRLEKMLAGAKGLYPVEDVYRKLDGTSIDVEVMATLLTNIDKPAVHVIVNDITERKRHEQERENLLQLTQAVFNNHDAVMMLLEPISGKIMEANPAAAVFYGYSKDELLSMYIQEINMLPPEEVEKRRLLALRKKRKYNLFPHRLKNGEIKLVDVYTCPIVYKGEKRLYSIIFDATDRERYREELIKEKEYLKSLFQYANAPIMTWSPDFKITEFNQAFEKLTGRSREQVIDQHIDILFPGESKAAAMRSIESALNGDYWHNLEIPIVHVSGAIRYVLWNSSNISSPDGELAATIAHGMDITERRIAEEKLVYLSYHDHLTGLYNRRFFEEELTRLDVERNLPLALVMSDVNGLKLINDSFGHEAGDDLLVKAAQIIKQACRPDDIIARIGGDEFVVILPHTDAEEAERVVNRIRELVMEVKLSNAVLSLSLGYAVKDRAEDAMQKVLAEAENFMYKRKIYESASMRNKTVNIILYALFEKSHREMLHSKRVSIISAAIATKLGLQKHDVDRIRVFGLIHDIGKIGVEEKILNKQGKLDELEWMEMKKHPEIGWRILASANEFSELAQFVLTHHERWDGKGYPEGLKGEEISIETRIVAVADAFDAMTSQRSYRRALNAKAAVAELKRCSGTQFDSRIVDVLINQVLGNQFTVNY